MNDDLEARLHRALRPVDPGEQFTQRVLARIASEPARSTPRLPPKPLRWASAALAASIIFGLVVAHQWQAQRTQQGLAARRQLLEALRVTSDKLDIAYRAVNDGDRPTAATDEDHGT
jgi:negative regulator of sigma E activity